MGRERSERAHHMRPVHEADIEYVQVVIRNLRQKIELDPARPRIIINDPGVGYRIVTD